MKRSIATSIFTALLLVPVVASAQLKEGDLVAICGDSITEQKDYSVDMESYLLMCQPVLKLQTVQFGWGGETSWGFKARMANDTLRFKPTVATTCYGMNDGGYGPLPPERAAMYRDAQRGVVEEFKKAGVRFIVVGSPGCVDSDTFRRDPAAAVIYNKTLSQLRDIAREVAQEQGVAFANVYDPMIDVMAKAKAKYGKEYHVGGGDGVHPAANGHLVMAYAFLKGLGCNGEIGTIRVDLAAGKAEASEGHKVLSAKDGAVEIESSKYPFCFYGDPSSTNSTTGVLEFLPFNQELNRLKLVVTGTTSDKTKVTWGEKSKEYTSAELGQGINLAADFLDNPFSKPFGKAQQVIRAQQAAETPLIKSLLHNLPQYGQLIPEETSTIDRLTSRILEKDRMLREASVAAVKPVKHTIRIAAVK